MRIVGFQAVWGFAGGHAATAHRRFMLRYPGFEGFTSFPYLEFHIWKLAHHAHLRIWVDGVFGQSNFEGGRRLLCHCDAVASEVSG